MVLPLPLSDIFLTPTTPDGVIFVLYRAKNTLVYFWCYTRIRLLYSYISRLPVAWQSRSLVCILYNFPWAFQHRMGCFTDQSHESRTFFDMFTQKKSNFSFLFRINLTTSEIHSRLFPTSSCWVWACWSLSLCPTESGNTESSHMLWQGLDLPPVCFS